jgi:hypothetical protein
MDNNYQKETPTLFEMEDFDDTEENSINSVAEDLEA